MKLIFSAKLCGTMLEGASDAARATPTQKISHTEASTDVGMPPSMAEVSAARHQFPLRYTKQVVTDPDLWQAVTEDGICTFLWTLSCGNLLQRVEGDLRKLQDLVAAGWPC